MKTQDLLCLTETLKSCAWACESPQKASSKSSNFFLIIILTYPALLASAGVGLDNVRRVHANVETQRQRYTPSFQLQKKGKQQQHHKDVFTQNCTTVSSSQRKCKHANNNTITVPLYMHGHPCFNGKKKDQWWIHMACRVFLRNRK